MTKQEVIDFLLKETDSSQLISFNPASLEAYKDLQDEKGQDLRIALIETYLKITPPDMESLNKSLESDPNEFHRLAHTLKSTSAAVGGLLISQIFASLEQGSHSVEMKKDLLNAAHEEFKNLKSVLMNYAARNR